MTSPVLQGDQWQHEGHEWIGKRVARQFNNSVILGTIVSWLPAGKRKDDFALWKVEHDDRDLEDLEQHEVQDALILQQQGGAPHSRGPRGPQTNKACGHCTNCMTPWCDLSVQHHF